MTLSAVKAVLYQSFEVEKIFVVENGSEDESPVVLTDGLLPYDPKTRLLINRKNLGFGAGCNTALREILKADYDFVWLLNNDASPIVDCLQSLIRKAQSFKEIPGIVGSWLVDPDKHVEGHYGSWMNPLTMICGSVTDERQLESLNYSWVTAASMLISIPALREVGIFEERFFMYWEDADLNMRMREKGLKITAEEKAVVFHSAGTSSAKSLLSRYIWHFQSQFLWLSRHHRRSFLSRLLLIAKFLTKSLWDLDFRRLRGLVKVIWNKDWL